MFINGQYVGVTQGYYVLDGAAFTLPTNGNVSATAHPDHEPVITTPATAASVDTSWVGLGDLESMKLTRKPGFNLKPLGSVAGSGIKQPTKVLQGAMDRVYTAMMLQRSKLGVALFHGTTVPVDTGSNTELPALAPDQMQTQYGWLYYEQFDANTANLMLERAYLRVAMNFNGDITTDDNKQMVLGVDFTVLSNALNKVLHRNGV